MSANAIETLLRWRPEVHGSREHSDCPCVDCFDQREFSLSVAAVKTLLAAAKRALVYWDADDVDSLDSAMLEVEKAIRRVESGQ